MEPRLHAATRRYGAVAGVERLDDAFRFRPVLLSVQPETCLTWPCVRGAPLGFHRMPPPVTVSIKPVKPVGGDRDCEV